MATISLTFSHPINVSVQKGDMAYYLDNIQTLPNTTKHSKQSDIIQIGVIDSIDRANNIIVCTWDPDPANSLYPTNDSFIMFSKNNKANLSSLLGYYAEIKFANGSIKKIKLLSRIDTANEIEYYKNGGILKFVLRNMI